MSSNAGRAGNVTNAEDGPDLFLSVKSFFAAPTIGTFLYRALYTASSSSGGQEQSGTPAHLRLTAEQEPTQESSCGAVLLGRFSQTYSTSTATSRSSIRRGGPIRRTDRPDISTTASPDLSSSTPTLPASSSSTSLGTSTLGSELEGNSVFISPASRIVGRFQDLLELDCGQHFLCEYVDITKGKHDRLFIVAEHCEHQLSMEYSSPSLATSEAPRTKSRRLIGCIEDIQRLSFELLVALNYLHSQGIVHRSLCADSVHIDRHNHVKLADYGMYYVTQACANVNFVLASNPRYLAPEVLLSPPFAATASAKADIWSFGIILLEMLVARPLFGVSSMADQHSSSAILKEMDQLSQLFITDYALAQQRVVSLINATSLASSLSSPELQQIIAASLTIDPDDRPTSSELLEHPWYAKLLKEHLNQTRGYYEQPFVEVLNRDEASALQQRIIEQQKSVSTAQFLENSSFESLRDCYHFWQLSGCDLEREEQLRLPPPILRLPTIVRVDGSAYPHPAEASSVSEPSLVNDTRTLLISLRTLQQRLRTPAQSTQVRFFSPGGELPPLSVREHDIEYQSFRVRVFRDLLAKWPASKDSIITQAKIDIPPLLRAQIWRRLLNVNEETAVRDYNALEKELEGPFDHQIELDIPRCHQYHQLLSSPEGHSKFRRILKAWASANPLLSYWQGLDSLLAPFLVRNFNNEAMAFCCLNILTHGPLRSFFGKSNAQYLQEHLLLFRQLLCYHDPELALHLHTIGLEPELFGIPWFLTLFTHVFSLDKVYLIWDTLLLDPYRLPLFFGVSMLIFLRTHLLSLDFNNAVVFISNLPAIDFESCLKASMTRYDRAPPSLSEHIPLCPNASEVEQSRELTKAKGCLVPSLLIADVTANKIRQPFLLLDIRKPADFKAQHIEGSMNLNHKDPTLAWLEPYRKTDIVIVAYPTNRDQAIKFANGLASPPNGYPYISLLHVQSSLSDSR